MRGSQGLLPPPPPGPLLLPQVPSLHSALGSPQALRRWVTKIFHKAPGHLSKRKLQAGVSGGLSPPRTCPGQLRACPASSPSPGDCPL